VDLAFSKIKFDRLPAFARNLPEILPDWQHGSPTWMFPFFLIPGYKQSTHVSSFFQAGTRFFSLHNNFCVDRSKLLVHFFYPRCFNPKFPLFYSFLLPLIFKLLLYLCPSHTPRASVYMFLGHRSLIWFFHFNRSGFSNLDLLWVSVVVYVQRAYHGYPNYRAKTAAARITAFVIIKCLMIISEPIYP
jgi:hypothetical protein